MGKLHNRPHPPKTLGQSDAFAAHSRSGQRWRDLTGCNGHGGREAWHDTPAAYFGGSFLHPFFGVHPKKLIPWGNLFKGNLANFENGFRVSSCKTCKTNDSECFDLDQKGGCFSKRKSSSVRLSEDTSELFRECMDDPSSAMHSLFLDLIGFVFLDVSELQSLHFCRKYLASTWNLAAFHFFQSCVE